MRSASRVYLSSFVLVRVACRPGTTAPSLGAIGLSGGGLGDGFTVVVVDEAAGEEVIGATVSCGDLVRTSAAGVAVRCAAPSADTGVLVSADGRVTERWMGLTEVVGLARRSAVRAARGDRGSGRSCVGRRDLEVVRGARDALCGSHALTPRRP